MSYIELLIPFLCALPYSFSIFTDKKTNSDVLYCAYNGKKKYVISKICATFIGSFVLFFVPLLIELILNYLLFDNSMGANLFNPNWDFQGAGVFRKTDFPQMPFGNILAFSPLVYSLVYSALFSLLSAVFGVFALASSVFFFQRNKILTFASEFVILNVLTYVEQYCMNGDISSKYTAVNPFLYSTFYYTSGDYKINKYFTAKE